ncbi:hypothetical protein Aab01nite_03310 [Paractinoplanes abujensis]|uniref:Type VII secretion-associated serine protease mycosin n=1 Tax=Paractinoplanes abujensis TaxID=882441 RepID=A0A7W7G0P0_9ACTN|nr:type VII secretion-associated serine protease mycosin [Actinoplanes abujensis]MBB4691837.1 type VII secretion-associated serine protease mycosin [Actinoplanes abujensis]GID16741.1 hypothetical protein Aab01nite_03310 [Actinoplanes abujensis]
MTGRRLVAVAAVAAAVLTVPAPARAKVVCQSVAQAKPVVSGVPLEDRMYDPKRLAPFATGAGIRVAVIDSGVDATHPQLRGHVSQGADFLHGERSGRQDCNGHGTAVASIIGAVPADGTGFQGLAPEAVIVPVRISEQQEIDGKAVGDRGTPAQFAEAIDWAAGQGRADVINLSLVMTDDNDAVRRAVARAVARGVVVVAAAGNKAQSGNPTPFPAQYDGVIGVGAITPEGVRAPFSQRGDYVDIVAMGAPVTAAGLVGGHDSVQGTSFSAPFVAATAALIKQRFPTISPLGVERRLTATADPAPGGGPRSPDYGFGALNPYRALTANLAPAAGPAPPPEVVDLNDPAAAALEARRDRSRDQALIFAGVGIGLVLLLGVVAAVVRQGRRRGWRPAAGGHTD